MELPERPRRNRRTAAIRDAIAETDVTPAHLIQPLFVHDEKKDEVIEAMPGQSRWSLAGLLREVERCLALGITKFVLFPKIDDALKTPDACEAVNPEGLVPRALRAIKSDYPQAYLITDVALDPYNSDGHDGLVSDAGEILNDATVEVLCQQALCHAQAGADMVAPSDMMDGRVGAIRQSLDSADLTNVSIMSYTAKYASCFYGPFRGALDSAPRETSNKPIPSDKKTYQMDPRNKREALREARLDVDEGADVLMVKPAGPYLDVIAKVREATDLPIAAYQVSGEYLMIVSAAEKGWIDRQTAIMESLIGIRRAGADMVLTYFAAEYAGW